MRNLATGLGLALVTVGFLFGQTKEVSPEEAARHLIKKVPAVYPKMAEIARTVKNMGHLLLYQGKAPEALQNCEEELAIAQKAGKDYEHGLAGAHANLGNAKRDLGDPKGAVEHYESAESIYRQISKKPASEPQMKMNAYVFRQVLRSHAEVLRQSGQPDAAASLEREAATIVVNVSR